MYQGASPIYPAHVGDMSAAYEQVDTPEAAGRKLSLVAANQSAGRSGEIAYVTKGGMSWDPHFKVVFAESLQSKTSKPKWIAFAAAPNRHLCFFTALGDDLVARYRHRDGRRALGTPHAELPRDGDGCGGG